MRETIVFLCIIRFINLVKNNLRQKKYHNVINIKKLGISILKNKILWRQLKLMIKHWYLYKLLQKSYDNTVSVLHSNKSLCYKKLGDWEKTFQSAKIALDYDKENLRA